MNEEALEYSFNLFKADGYNGTLEDYKALIEKDKEALDYSYGLFSSDGYNGSIEEFSTLVGAGNQQGPAKETANAGSKNQAVDGESTLADGSLGLKKYDEATRLSEEELKAIDLELNQIDFTPIKRTKIISGGYEGMIGSTYEEIEQPYENYLNEAKKDLEKEAITTPITEELIQKKALDIIKQEKKYNLILNKNKEYLKELPEEEKRKIASEKVKQFRDIEWSIEDDWKAIEAVANKYNNSANIKNLENLEKAFNDPNFKFDLTYAAKNNQPVVVLEDGRTVPEATLNAYKEAFEAHTNHVSFIKQAIKDYENKLEKVPALAIDIDFLNKNYNRLDKLSKIAESSLAEAGFGLYAAALDLSEIYDPSSAAVMKSKKEDLNAVRKEMQKKLQEDYVPSVKFENAFDNAENFGNFFAESLAGQTGTLAMLASGNAAGLTGIAASTYGRTISDIEILDEEKKSATSNIEKRLTALGYASFETALGAVPTVKLLKGVGDNLSKSSARSLYKGVGDFARKNYKEIPNAFVTEFVSEGATQLGQNGIDVIRGEKSIQNIFDGVPEGAVTGGMLGTTLSSMPILKGATLAAFSDYKKYNQFRKNAEAIQVLNEEIVSLDKRTNNYKNKVKLINDLTSENSQILDGIENNISNNLSPQGFELYQQRTTEQEQIRLGAEQISKRKDLSKEDKAKRLDILQAKFDALQKKRDIYKRDFKDTFSVEESAVVQKYTDLAEQTLAKDNITDQAKIDKKARELYNVDKIKDRNEKAVKAINALKKGGIINNYDYELSNNDLVQAIKDYYDKAVEDGNLSETKAKKLYYENRKALLDGKVNGFNLPIFDSNNNIKGYDIYVSQENALNNGKTETAIHELGHSIFIETLGADPNAYNSFAKDIMIYLEKTNKSAFNRIIEGTKDQAADEILMNFLEEVSSGRLDLDAKNNKNFVATVGLGLRNIFSKSTKSKDVFTFDGVNDITTFLKELGKKIADGQLQVKDIEAIKANKMLADNAIVLNPIKQKIKKSQIPSIQKAFTELEDKMIDGEIDYNTYEAKLKELENKLEKAEKQEVAEKEKPTKKKVKKEKEVSLKEATAKSKSILDNIGNDPNGFDKNNPKIYEVLEGIIRSKSKVFRTAGGNVVNLTNLPGFEMENMVQETITGLVPLINKFDPKKNDSLFGYLNAQLANKMRGALKSGRVTDQTFTEDVSTAKGITAEETTTKQPEKPKYVKIMDADVFDTKVINAISDKMVSTVRVLKNKLIAALGKNQNTSPLIAEILSDISTQADIDIKKAMGGKKDGVLRKFLLKNKQAIIENSTTTFLMGKDQGDKVLGGLPIAIQKQVDGKFLSYPEWIGKKIDRETTEKRGATAGNQIVRRVPANRISDADYLSFFLQSTGNPIRGRKEALAKELSGEIGLELFVEAAESGSGPIFEAFEKNQELLGAALMDNYMGEITKQVERGTIKFSESRKLNNQFNEIKNKLLQTKKSKKATAKYLQDLENIALKIENSYNLNPLDDANAVKVKVTELLQKIVTTENVNRGELAEQEILDVLKSVEKQTNGIISVPKGFKPAGKRGGVADIEYNIKGIDEPQTLEIKLNTYASLSTIPAQYVSGVGESELSINFPFVTKEYSDKINKFLQNYKPYKDFFAMLKEKNNEGLLRGKIEESKGKNIIVVNDYKENNKYGFFYEAKRKVTNKYGNQFEAKIELPFAALNERLAKKSFNTFEIQFMDAGLVQINPETLLKTKNKIDPENDTVLLRFIIKKSDRPSRGGYSVRITPTFFLSDKTRNKILANEDVNLINVNSAKLAFSNAKDIASLDQNISNKSTETLFLGAVLNPVVNMKKFDPYEMADIIASELFRDSKKYRNRQKFEYLYKNLTKEEQYKVQKEMRKKNLTPFGRGISVWDFDDTLATTKSNVLYTLPGGITGKLNAEEFAKRGDELLEQGAEFDFSEFEKVMKGAKGPMFEKAMERNKRFGNESVFILTARPANSATAIHEFLKGIGLDIRLENIVGLGNSTAQAKADWVKGMVAEGYNDFYFADDAYKNVKAVQEVLKVADVKSKVQQANVKFSQTADPKMLDKEFNLMLERTKGVKAGAVISPSRAEQLGKGKGRLDLFLPPNAEDFQGLLYKFLGKGKQGNADMKFFKENLFDPFNRAENAMSTFRQQLADNLKILKRELGNIDEDIDAETIKKIEAIGFTPDQAVRVFVWNRLGEDIPDLTKQEKAKILSVVRRDASLMRYARELMKITEQFGGYPPPSKSWFAGNSTSDLYQYANENVRAKYLEQWQANADAIFSPKNMTKIQALYGKNFAKNLKEVLRRMKSGSNRPLNLNDTGSKMLDYINGSVGTIMFLNMRSAVLQTISAVNFLNWHDNNLFAAGKTLANPKNFVKTFMEIMNSDFLKQRRNGLEINVSEAEIANAVEQSKNKAKAIFSKIIKFGYKPTQFADSFAIAAGGTSFLINRTKTYEKTGLSPKEAREKAFTDFRAIAEENQQSSRTDRTSNIQASNLGRLVFAFNNTPFQMTRLFKKATLDLINGRGDRKTNISKMLYYGVIQNVIFFSLQQAFIAMLFGADEDDREDIDNRTERLLNSTIDSILRGSGLPGAVISTAKNVIMEYTKQEAKGDWRADHGKTLIQALNFSPPLGSKASRIYSALKGRKYEKTYFDALLNQSKIISAITNIPVDRIITKIDNLRVATSEPIETWKRLALFAGWDQWSLGVYDDLKAIEDKEKGKEKKKSRSEIMKEVWRKRKEEDKKHRDSIINTFRKKK